MNRNPVFLTGLARITISLANRFRLPLPIRSSNLDTDLTMPIIHTRPVGYACALLPTKPSMQQGDFVLRNDKLFFANWANNSFLYFFRPINISTFLRTSILNPALKSIHFFSALFTMPKYFSSAFFAVGMWFGLSASKSGRTFPRAKSSLSTRITFKHFSTPFTSMLYEVFSATITSARRGAKAIISFIESVKRDAARFANKFFYVVFFMRCHVLCILFSGSNLGANRQRNGTCRQWIGLPKPQVIIT